MKCRLAVLALGLACPLVAPGAAKAYTPNPPSLQVYFSPLSVGAGQTATLTYALSNPPSNTLPLNNVSFNDPLPSGLKVLSESRTVCGDGHLTLTKPTGVDLAGLTLPVGGSCNIDITVYTLYAGEQSDDFAGATADGAGAGFGGTTYPALNVWAPPVVALQFNPSTVAAGNASTLVLWIENPDTSHYFARNINADIALPAGVVAGPLPAAGACEAASITAAGGTIHVRGFGLPTGSNCVIEFTVHGTAPGSHTATAIADVDGWAFAGNVKTATLTVSPAPPPAAPSTVAPPTEAPPAETPPAEATASGPEIPAEPTVPSDGDSGGQASPTIAAAGGSPAQSPTSGDPSVVALAAGAAALGLAGLLVLAGLMRRRRKPVL